MTSTKASNTCPDCGNQYWNDQAVQHIICPHCGAKLNEFSSEDADDGKFKENTNVDILVNRFALADGNCDHHYVC